jgi:hypothetical protein
MIEDPLFVNGFQSCLAKVISFSESNVMHSENIHRWDEFGGLWSQEDRTNLNCLRNRITIDAEGKKNLTSPLTRQEKAWAANFVWRVMLAERLL